MTRRVTPLLLVAAVACGSNGSPTASQTPSPTSNRRSTTATLHILEPKNGATVATKVTVRLRVDGAPVLDPNDVTATTGGHVHLYVDGKLNYMTKDLVMTVTLQPGQHNLRAEFVAPDHQPFLNRVVATVVFTVKA